MECRIRTLDTRLNTWIGLLYWEKNCQWCSHAMATSVVARESQQQSISHLKRAKKPPKTDKNSLSWPRPEKRNNSHGPALLRVPQRVSCCEIEVDCFWCFFLVIRAAAYDISPRALAVRKGLNAFIQQLLYRQQRGNRVTESGGLIRRDQGEHCDVLY